MSRKSWKHHPMARTCEHCKSQRPGMQPLRLIINGQIKRGFWHLECFEVARNSLPKREALPNSTPNATRNFSSGKEGL
jgi:hypothetical protein